MKTACERIMEHIEQIRKVDNFDKRTMRWRNARVDTEFQGKNVHVSELDYDRLTQPELVDIFMLILRRYGMQM